MTETDLYIQWAIAAAVLLVMAARKQLLLFSPMAVYLAFHFIAFVIRPTMVLFFDFDFVLRYMELPIRPEKMQLALWLSSAGLLAFYTSYSVFSAKAKPLEFGEKREMEKHDRMAFYVVAALFGPLGFYSIFAAQPEFERIGGTIINTGTSGYVNEMQNTLIPVVLIFLLVSKWQWWSYGPFLVYIYYRLNQGWGRWTVILSFFCLVLVWLWDHRRKFPPMIFIVLGALLAPVFLMLSHDRQMIKKWIEWGDTTAESVLTNEDVPWREKYDTLDFANYDFLAYIVAVVPDKTHTHTYATQYLQLFTEPIPRKLWKNKPVGPPVQYFDLNNYGNFVGLTNSLVGDGWMSGGWLGAMLTMSIAGGALGWFYTWFTNNQHVVHRACGFLIVNSMLLQLYRDGGISIFRFLIFTLPPLFLWNFLSKQFGTVRAAEKEREQLKEARLRKRGIATGADDEAEDDDDDDSEGGADSQNDDRDPDDESNETGENNADENDDSEGDDDRSTPRRRGRH